MSLGQKYIIIFWLRLAAFLSDYSAQSGTLNHSKDPSFNRPCCFCIFSTLSYSSAHSSNAMSRIAIFSPFST